MHTAEIDKHGVTPLNDDTIPSHYSLSMLRSMLDDSCILLSEGISKHQPIANAFMRNKSGSYFTSGATGLGLARRRGSERKTGLAVVDHSIGHWQWLLLVQHSIKCTLDRAYI
jgi:hypothetical protein